MMQLVPQGVSLHFSRLVASGPTGTPEGQEERNCSYIANIDASTTLLAMVRPDVIVLAHTASSYSLSAQEEKALIARLESSSNCRFLTAAGSVLQALAQLHVRRVALATPYAETISRQGKQFLESHGLQIVGYGRLDNVRNIYEESAERAYRLARQVDTDEAEAVFISGTGLPTLSVLALLEADLGKPVLSSASAMMWHALRTAGIGEPIPGYGRLLT